MKKLIYFLSLLFLILSSNVSNADQLKFSGSIKTSGSIGISRYKPTLLTVGDSITVGAAQNAGFGYRRKLQDLLGIGAYNFVGSEVSPASNATYSVKTSGKSGGGSGYTADQYTRISTIEMINNFVGSQPGSCVLFHGGTNDTKADPGGGLSISGTVNRVADSPLTTASSVGYVMINYPTVDMYVALIIPSQGASNDANFTTYNTQLLARLQSLQGSHSRLHIVDMNSAFRANASWSSLYLADSLHPTDAGYNLMGQTWYDCIRDKHSQYCDGN